MVHTRLSSVKKKKYNFTTSKIVRNSNNGSNYDSNIVNSDNSVITIVSETETQVAKATQDVERYFATSEALTEGVANLGCKMANELEKLQCGT